MLDHLNTDHFAICLFSDGTRWVRTPFRFEDKWLQADGFQDRVNKWWCATNPERNKSFRSVQRLKHAKSEIKRRSKEEEARYEM